MVIHGLYDRSLRITALQRADSQGFYTRVLQFVTLVYQFWFSFKWLYASLHLKVTKIYWLSRKNTQCI